MFAVSEALLQYDNKTKKPYVEIETTSQKFERKRCKTWISDGVNAELIEGIKVGDKIKVWNRTELDKERRRGWRLILRLIKNMKKLKVLLLILFVSGIHYAQEPGQLSLCQ